MKSLLHRFDRHIMNRVQTWPDGIRLVMEAATVFGHPIVVLAVAGVLVFPGWKLPENAAAIGGWSIVATLVISSILKLILRRRRPATYVMKRWFSTFSFPSGHTAGATVTYGVLAAMGVLFANGLMAVFVALVAVILVSFVGISRIYLGAHYPSDVVAGWLLGFAGLGCFVIGMALS